MASGRCGNVFQSFLGVITSIYELGDPNYTPCSKIHSMGRKWPLATGGPHCASEQDNRSLARLTSGLVEDSAAQGYGKLEPKELFSEAASNPPTQVGQLFSLYHSPSLQRFYFPD